MSVIMVQTKRKLNSTELLLKLFHIQSKEIGNNKYYEETTELEKWQRRFRLNIDVRKEMEDSRPYPIKQLPITFVKFRLNFSSKSTTAADVHLMGSLLENWLKNNNITIDIIYYLRSQFVSFFTHFSFQIYFSTAKKQKNRILWQRAKIRPE